MSISVIQNQSLVLPNTVIQKELFRADLKDKILNGEVNPLEFYRQAKLFTDLIEDLKKDSDIFDCAQTERLKYGKEKPVINGSVVDISSRSTPDYNSCNDPVYDDLKEKIKAREQFLKALPKEGLIVTDPETGETKTIFPPIFKESSFVTVKI
jgi:biotin synthase-related radical SAM superfamily protein